MILSKVLSKYQVTLPRKIVQALRIKKGHVMSCCVQDGAVVLTPVVVEEPYSEDDLKTFETLYQNPKNKGAVYSTRKEALAHLKRLRAES